ncbi:Lrp/AsnC family transcriptional regulator [Psychrobacter sp. UBA3962]|uniref:Lrp/AsnC family transcriptional regulator n=1 Tax=Psychrobacter sp. UBA3962 TaxID=1947352 RepID=UPI0025CEF72D|nr:Lrp/AsnC family transcriptional regulator [Psychrobacter sp. UBA3962]
MPITPSLEPTEVLSIDYADQQILVMLQENARINVSDIATSLNISTTTCTRRIKRLEECGMIRGYHAQVNAKKLGYNLSVYIAVSMETHTADSFNKFEEKIREFKEVMSCSIVTGRSEDYLLKVLVKDMEHFEDFILHKLNHIEGVSNIQTSIELRDVLKRS